MVQFIEVCHDQNFVRVWSDPGRGGEARRIDMCGDRCQSDHVDVLLKLKWF